MLLIKPFLGCNLACKYCYERHYRKNAKPKLNYDLDAIFKRMEEFKDLDMTLHGGEPLVLPKKDLEKIFGKMLELRGKSALQTNATLIDDGHIKMFKKYKTSVGVSFDGPGELSDYRPGSSRVEQTVRELIKEGLKVSMIMVVTRANAGAEKKLEKLKNYLLELDKMGIRGRVNPCGGAPECELKEKDLIRAYLELGKFCLENNLQWSPFTDIVCGLQGKSRVCTFMGCDSFHTASATTVLGDGSVTNCMRLNQKGILLRHPAQYDTRKEILQETPQEFGGCKDCKYWNACCGGCPSVAIDNDWRNRTYLCSLWKNLFEYFEKVLRFAESPLIFETPQKGECDPWKRAEKRSGVIHLDHADTGLKEEYGDSHGDDHGDDHGDSHGDWDNHADSNL